MRAEDLDPNISQTKPIIYLDMDGVLADFFHEYAKLAGVPENERGRHDYHLIPPALREPVINQMVGTNFFFTLPKFPTADALVQTVVSRYGSYDICSSPLRSDHENSGHWKREWIKKYLTPYPKKIVITPNKEKYALQPDGTPNVLIDDRGDNIRKWQAAGGWGIKYQADEDSLDVVKDGLDAFDKELRQRRLTESDSAKSHQAIIDDFIRWVYDKENIKAELPQIKFQSEKEGPDQHRTGYYEPDTNILWVYTGNRNLVDILRTVAHELVHRKQGSEGRIKVKSPPGSKLEREADSEAGYLMKLYTKQHPEVIE
jgi:5'(3')-deoxyribonucleotidase